MKVELPTIPLYDIESNIILFIKSMKPHLNQVDYQYLLDHYHLLIDLPTANALLNKSYLDNNSNYTLKACQKQYLSNRLPLLTSSNYTLLIKPLALDSYLVYSTKLIYSYLISLSNINDIKSKISLSQLPYYTNGYRKYKDECDSYIYQSKLNNIGLFYHNHYFNIPIINDGILCSIDALYETIKTIYNLELDDIINFNHASLLGSNITTTNLKDNQNIEIDLALAIFTLNDHHSSSLKTIALSDGNNIYPYQSLSIAIYQDNYFSINSEHTNIDGMSNLLLLNDV
ncbi:MAG: choline/carnitine O-acyltransferase, partial [Bacilli bacterium]